MSHIMLIEFRAQGVHFLVAGLPHFVGFQASLVLVEIGFQGFGYTTVLLTTNENISAKSSGPLNPFSMETLHPQPNRKVLPQSPKPCT